MTEAMVNSSELPPEPQWMIWGKGYTAPADALFALNFLGRNWFDAKLPPWEVLTLVRLLIALYAVQKQGLLLSRKDVMRTLGAEHISTATRYTDVAIRMGLVKSQKAKLDTRVQLLYLTPAGQKAVERELEVIKKTARWLVADMGEYRNEKGEKVWSYEFSDSITVQPPKLEELSIVNDELVKAPPGSVPPMRGIAHRDEGAQRAWLQKYAQATQRYRPLTARRWVAAYAETLLFDEKNQEALSERADTNFKMLDDDVSALIDLDKLVDINPADYLARRAEVRLARDDFDGAIADIDQLLLVREVNYPWPFVIRAKAHARKDKWEKAAADIDVAVNKTRSMEVFKDGDIRWREEWEFLRGVVLLNVGRVDEAADALLKAREGYEGQAGTWEDELRQEEARMALTPDTVRAWRDDALARVASIDNILEVAQSLRRKPSKAKRKRQSR